MTLSLRFARFLVPSLAATLLAACVVYEERTGSLPAPRPGNVQEVPEFHTFIDEYAPTPEEFRTVYPDITLVLPGDIATKELRMNNSRFFAELDERERIVGGRFQ